MLLIEGVDYGVCGHCRTWRPADELVWDNERLDWVCYEPSHLSFSGSLTTGSLVDCEIGRGE